MCSFKSIYFVIFILNLYESYGEISDKRLCIDPACKEPVSLAKTLLRYSSPDPRILSFAPNTEITIYSKEAGSETNLWGAAIQGKRGYVPKHLVREYKMYKKPTLLVDTELKQKPQVPNETDKDSIDPNSVKKPYEVVDGTTIYLNPQDDIEPSSTESPVLSTSLPPVNKEDKQNVPVNTLKENYAGVKKNAEESVVENVLSSLSNWMNDDADSEEQDVEDDDEEDDEDDEDEEDDSLEEDTVNSDIKLEELNKNEGQDINLLQMAQGIKISPFNLEVSQPLGVSEDTSKEDVVEKKELPDVKVTESKSTDMSIEEVADDTLKKDMPLSKDMPVQASPSLDESSEPTKLNEAMSPAEKTTDVKIKEKEAIQSEDESVIKDIEQPVNATSENELVGNKDPGTEQTELNYNIGVEKAINTESVTETSIGVEELQVPILDDITPNPLDLQQDDSKTESVSFEKTEEIKNEVNTSDVTVDKTPDLPQESNNKESDDDPPMDQNLTNEDANFLIVQNETSEGQKEVTDSEESNTADSSHKIIPDTPSETNKEESQQNDLNKEEINTEDTSREIVPDTPTEVIKEEIQQNDLNVAIDNANIEISNPTEDTDETTGLEGQVQNEEVSQKLIEETIEDKLVEEIQNDGMENTSEDHIEVTEVPLEDPNDVPSEESTDVSEGGGILSGLFSFFGGNSDEISSSTSTESEPIVENELEETIWKPQHPESPLSAEGYCDASSESCNASQQKVPSTEYSILDNIDLKFNSDIFLLLVTTAGSVIVFLFIYMALDRHKREGPLVARINKLEKELLVTLKENELLQEKGGFAVQETEDIPNEVVEQLTQRLAEAQQIQRVLEEKVEDLERQVEAKSMLEEQIESLEKELETSTEVGMELNRIISEMLDPTNGSERLKENVEQLQRQLLEQKDTINRNNETLHEKETENRALRVELERSKKVTADLQSKVDEMVEKILKIEKEKEQQQNSLQTEITIYQQKYNDAISKEEILNNDIQVIRVQLSEAQRQVDLKTKEYQSLKDSLNKVKSLKNDGEALKSLLDATSIRAEIQQLKAENVAYASQLQQEQAVKVGFEKKYQAMVEEMSLLKQKYEQADKEKVEVNSKLEVLNNYFKKRESELQEEIIKYKSIWDAKEGEATSTTERIKYMQEEIENYKGQNETLKQEIISQEIDLKSQISMLEKKVHENWVTARQTERKLEDAKQEAAQLRNRLTLRERAINEERIQNRLQSPVEQNGDLTLSPHPIDSPASPPLLYGARDHITKSPPIPGMPPFLPPPPGAPFMPPPMHGMPPFMPPPPSMFPGDHRPPPLGRMSSPPLNSRYSPDSSAFSPYDRRSPSPPYDSEYGASPPPMRGYSPYNGRDDRRDYKRPPHGRTNGRNVKGSVMSSGSDHSNDSLEKINRKQSKMV